MSTAKTKANQASASDPKASPPMTEAELEAAITQLDGMHDQLEALRPMLQNILRVLATPHRRPEDLFLSFREAAHGGSRKLNHFKNGWTSEQTQQLLQRAKEVEKTTGPDTKQEK